VARQGAAGRVIDGKLYLAGGWTADNLSSKLEVYDPGSNTWSTKASMLTARSQAAAAVRGGRLYVIGGSQGNDVKVANEVYVP
jgi:N-acetylneuraminic acid mutarotase